MIAVSLEMSDEPNFIVFAHKILDINQEEGIF